MHEYEETFKSVLFYNKTHMQSTGCSFAKKRKRLGRSLGLIRILETHAWKNKYDCIQFL